MMRKINMVIPITMIVLNNDFNFLFKFNHHVYYKVSNRCRSYAVEDMEYKRLER